MKIFTPIVLIIISVALFFLFTDPRYDQVKELQAEEAKFDEALERSKELIELKDGLLAKYNSFSAEDLERLEKLLPDNVDNVRLILVIDNISAQYGLLLKDVSVDQPSSNVPSGAGQAQAELGSITLEFSVGSDYENFVQFIMDLEDSLRVVDITLLSFTVNEDESDEVEYTVGIETYWLR